MFGRVMRQLPEWLVVYLCLGPMLALIGLLFIGGVIAGLGQSVDYLPMLGKYQFSLAHYRAILLDRDFWFALLLTLYISITSTLVATALGIGSALALRRVGDRSRWITFVYQIPLPVPHMVAAAGMVMLLTQSGVIARIFYAFGLLDQPGQFPALVFDRANVATLFVYIWKEAPFIGLVVLAMIRGTGAEYEAVARTLGANRWQRFRYVLLPLLMPGVLSTSVIVFAFLFGSFEVPLLLGQRYPSVLPVLAYRAYSDPDLARRPESMAMGMIITVIVIVLLAIYRRLARQLRFTA